MVTRWTRELLDEARALTQAREYRSALRTLLRILDVHPDQPEALELASGVVRMGSRRTTDAYDVRVYPGTQAGRRGQRWVIVKIFENRPKHVDPDTPATDGRPDSTRRP